MDADADDGPYDPQEEYRKLLELTERDRMGNMRGNRRGNRRKMTMPAASEEGEAYHSLMAKERRVLDTVDRVVNDSILRDAQRSSILFGMPVHELAMRTVGACRALFDDLVACRSFQEAIDALSDPVRLPFLGIALVAVAVFAGMLSLSSRE